MAIILIPDATKLNTGKKHFRWAVFRPMRGVCSICTAMFGNGAATGTMQVIMRSARATIRRAHQPVPDRAVCFAVAVGATMRRAAACHIAAMAARVAATTFAGSVWFLPQFSG